MARNSVALRHPFRLVVECCEDRALLSAGSTLAALKPLWLASHQLVRPLNTGNLSVLGPLFHNVSPVGTTQDSSDLEREGDLLSPSGENLENSPQDLDTSSLNSDTTESENLGDSSGDTGADLGQTSEETVQHARERVTSQQALDESTNTQEKANRSGNRGLSTENGSVSGENFLRQRVESTMDPAADADTEKLSRQDKSDNRDEVAENKTNDLTLIRELPQTADPIMVRVLKSEGTEQDSGVDRGTAQVAISKVRQEILADSRPNETQAYEVRESRQESSEPAASAAAGMPTLSADAGPYRTGTVSASESVAHGQLEQGTGGMTTLLVGLRTAGATAATQECFGPDRLLLLPAQNHQAPESGAGLRSAEPTELRPSNLPQGLVDSSHAAPARAEGMVRHAAAANVSSQNHVPASEVPAENATYAVHVAAEVLPATVPSFGVWDVAVFAPHMSGILESVVPFDREAVQAAVQQLLTQLEDLGGDAASWLARLNLSPWVVAVAVGLTACDVVRRRQQKALSGLVLTDEQGTPITWFPGLAGVWSMQDA